MGLHSPFPLGKCHMTLDNSISFILLDVTQSKLRVRAHGTYRKWGALWDGDCCNEMQAGAPGLMLQKRAGSFAEIAGQWC